MPNHRQYDRRDEYDPIVLTCEGRELDDAVTSLDDPGDLTELGMLLSARFQETASTPVRAGIFHTTELCDSAVDTRSVYRFLNSNLLTHLRRNESIGVAAVHSAADIDADVSSISTGMETSFTGRIDIEEASPSDVRVSVSGFGDADGKHVLSI